MKTYLMITASLAMGLCVSTTFAQQQAGVDNSNLSFGKAEEAPSASEKSPDTFSLNWLLGDDEEGVKEAAPQQAKPKTDEGAKQAAPAKTAEKHRPITPVEVKEPKPSASTPAKPKAVKTPAAKPKKPSKPKVSDNTKPKALPVATPKKEEATSDQPAKKPAELSDRQRELKRIEHYLNSITTIVANFTQVAPDGSLASGKFYLQRPGRMRWEYQPPTPVLIILDDWRFTYYDYELEQVTQLPVESSLAAILARKSIDLDDPDLVVEEMTTSPGAARIQLYQKGKKDEGTLLLEMSDQPLKLRNIVVTDAQGQTTTISLNKARFGVPLERSLFKWKDPRKKRR